MLEACDKMLIVIATYNEAENITPLTDQILNLSVPCDLLIVDDNSPDGTGRIADALASKYSRVHVLHRPWKRGLAPALVEGFHWGLERTYDFILNMDVDLSHDPTDFPKLLDASR